MQLTAILRSGSCLRRPTQLIRVMKLSALFLLVFCLQLSAHTAAQTVTLDLQNVPIQKIFKEASRQTGISIIYDETLFNGSAPVTVSLKDATIQDVLKACLKDQPFDYSFEGNLIVIRKIPRMDIQQPEMTISPIDIHGRVTDSLGNPLAGASVTVKGSNRGTETDANGNFVLKGVKDNATILISYTGYVKKQYIVNGKNDIAVFLSKSNSPLDEIQVIAYGTTTQRLSTGDVTTVTAKEIEEQPVTNPLLALQGRVPGLSIVQSTGIPGSGVTVRIMGQNTINAFNGSDPLYIIDGVPFPSQMLGTIIGGTGNAPITGTSGGPAGAGAGNPLSFINPSDIESIDVLKDADATAIYGSRGANGVILITTKKGKAGQTRIDVNIQQGFGKVASFQKLMNTQQYLTMRREAFHNDNATPNTTSKDYDLNGLWDTTRYTDWQKALIGGTSQYGNYTASVSGGTTNTQYLFSGTYHTETTVFPGNYSARNGSIHFNLNNTSSNQKFVFQFTSSYLVSDNKLPGIDLTILATELAPNAPALYNKDGSLNWAPNSTGTSSWVNPLRYAYQPLETKGNSLVSNCIIAYKILPGLEIKGSLGYTDFQANEFSETFLNYYPPETRSVSVRKSQFNTSDINSWIIEPQVSYHKILGRGNLDLLIGSTIQQQNSNGQQLLGEGYNSDQVMRDIQSAPVITAGNSINAVYNYTAFFGRVNYNFLNKYILDLNARRDGSSRFGVQNLFHNFASVGGAWIFSSEDFIQQSLPFLSFGKLRASYGTTGNDQIPDYAFMNLYAPLGVDIPYQGATGLFPSGLANPYLEWEETKKFEIALNIGLLKDRVILSGSYGVNRSSNQLLPYNLSSVTGFQNITSNFPATLQNTAWEFVLTTNNIKTINFSWTTSFNVTIAANKVVSFPNLESSSYSSTLVIGQPVDLVKLFHYLAPDPATGVYAFADNRGNPTTNPNYGTDNNTFYSHFPTLYGGFENSIGYKGFRLDFLFQFVKQKGQNYLFNSVPGKFLSGKGNQPSAILNRWQQPGDIAVYERFSQNTDLNPAYMNALSSDMMYSDASYIRLKNASLSWSLPDTWNRKAHLQNCRIYVQGQNLLTCTKYIGPDPETKGSGGMLPPLRVVTFGIQLSL